MKMTKAIALTGVLIAELALSACATPFLGEPESHQPGYGRAIPYFPYSADEATAARLRRVLAANLGVGADSLTVQVANGVVELGGRPGDLQTGDQAVRIAERTYGVNGVSNKMVSK